MGEKKHYETVGTYSRGDLLDGGTRYKVNPVPSFNFALEVELAFFMPLRSVRIDKKENEFEQYQEGGLNDYVHMLRKPVTRPFTFTVERYLGTSESADFPTFLFDPLSLGTQLILPVMLYVGRYPKINFSAGTTLASFGRIYFFTGCTVIAKDFGELNAEKSGLHTELTTISYREMFALDNPVNGIDLDRWEIEKGTKKQTNSDWPKTNTAKDPAPHKQWYYPGDPDQGSSVSTESHKTGTKSSTKTEERSWRYPGNPVDGSEQSTQSAAQQIAGEAAENRQWRYPENPVDGSKDSADSARHQDSDSKRTPQKEWRLPSNPVDGSKQSTDNARHQENEKERAIYNGWEIGDKPGSHENTAAKKAADTGIAEKHQWIYDGSVIGGGEQSAAQAEATEAEKRAWEYDGSSAGGGDRSSREAKDTGEPEKRAWEYDGSAAGGGDRSSREAKSTEAEKRAWEYDGKPEGGGDKSARQAANSEPETNEWVFDGSTEGGGQSSARVPADSGTAEKRAWEYNGSAEGGGDKSAKQSNSKKSSDGKKYDIKNNSPKSAKAGEDTGKPEGRAFDMKNGGKKSARRGEDTGKPEGRSWGIDGSGEKSARQAESSSAPESRGWGIDGSGEAQAAQAKDTGSPEARTWEYNGSLEGGGTQSAKANPSTKPEKLLWPPTRRAKMADALK
ncbi:MAG: hypothetical protein K5985_11065 [Lachnospiraceae bacterium]|nr:hypothetical protein [Lachnospiraceae bacterium]